MHIKYTYLLLISFFILSSTIDQENIEETIVLKTNTKVFTAGNEISLVFSGTQNDSIKLYSSNSYGSTILKSNRVNNNEIQYTFPKYISNKTGVVNWKLLVNEKPLFGNFTILPKEQPITLETYLGPPSIEAGGKDFAMFVVIPADELDNPVKTNTEVKIQHQFLASERKKQVLTKNLIAYRNIYSPTKSGRILLSSNCLGLDSKEYNLNVMPAISVNFEIFADRHHEYADGNQITTFTTSILKDSYGNIISDGSFVEFFITNTNGNILKTTGTTINGIATAKMIHPDHEENWSVKAYVVGISESKILKLKYKKIIHDFNVTFSKNNREILVGPLKSFMGQMIPDGLEVRLEIYKNGIILNQYLKESREGYVNFLLNKNIFTNGIYTIHIKTAGITEKFKDKKLW
ncbi:hypothetical protein [uncultured Tenacibaculum sp.]|uniref:hypothetical protein n=1 Tax=uncultured Tenacibaculum sp. TaxID=174713 RepID=UPI00260D004F|nr:hypothetical protein [uncultured Tenacibaculum sp.]